MLISIVVVSDKVFDRDAIILEFASDDFGAANVESTGHVVIVNSTVTPIITPVSIVFTWSIAIFGYVIAATAACWMNCGISIGLLWAIKLGVLKRLIERKTFPRSQALFGNACGEALLHQCVSTSRSQTLLGMSVVKRCFTNAKQSQLLRTLVIAADNGIVHVVRRVIYSVDSRGLSANHQSRTCISNNKPFIGLARTSVRSHRRSCRSLAIS